MSNIKELIIEGWMPFDANDYNKELLSFIGQLNLPANGFKLSYSGQTKYMPQENGGKYCFYEFSITGEEAVRWGYLDLLVHTLAKNNCIIEKAQARDLQDGPNWQKLPE
jgi:hypothetical protein